MQLNTDNPPGRPGMKANRSPGARGLRSVRWLWPLCAALLAGCATMETEPEEPEITEAAIDAQNRYIELVEKAQGDYASVDYAEMRELYTRTGFYRPYGGREARLVDRMHEALERGDENEALDLAGRILQHNYVSLEAHYVAWRAYEAMDDSRRAERHHHVLRALFDAIAESGDGDARSSAFHVISPREMQAFLALYNLDPLGSEVHADELGSHDRVTVYDPEEDEEFELWFDISIPTNMGLDGV